MTNLEIVRAIATKTTDLVLCTILEVKGSAPRHAGSWMLVGPRGPIAGSVGGGRGESIALAASREKLGSRLPEILEVDMQGTEAEGPAMVCGGTVRVLVEPLSSPAPYEAALGLLQRGERALLVKRLSTGETAVMDGSGQRVAGTLEGTDPAAVRRAIDSGRPHLAAEEGLFFDPLLPSEKLLVLGGGHVGRAVAALSPALGFLVTVADDRPEFLESGRYPAGVATRCGPYTETISAFPFDPSTYVVIVTRGHLCDLECVRAVLGRPYRYAGFIGSRRKVRLLLDQVLSEGFDPARVEALCAPIGLDFGAETPEELGVAIAGELIAVRRGSSSLGALHRDRMARRIAP
jgi:xanthine dehydrogenase accessory factor